MSHGSPGARRVPVVTLVLGSLLLATGCAPATDDRVIGASCTEKEQCSSGLCLQEEREGIATGWPDGYCTSSCLTSSCPTASTCLEMDEPRCLQDCAQHADCRPGYICQPVAAVCIPDCRRGWSCGTELVCGSDGFCVLPTGEPDGGLPDGGVADGGPGDAGVPDGGAADAGPEDGGGVRDGGEPFPPRRPVGAPCAQPWDCLTTICMAERAVGDSLATWHDGYCTRPCGPSQAPCPLGSGCLALAEGPLCLERCDLTGVCRPGYVCDPRNLVCLPDCRQGYPCPPPANCSPRWGFCATGGGGGGAGAR